MRRIMTTRPWRRELSPALPENAYQIPDRHDIPHGKIYYITKGHFIGCGATSFVEKLSSGNIVKSPKPNPYCPHEEVRCRQELMVEFEVYRRIGRSSRVPALIDWDADSHCLILEYLENGDLVSYLRQHASRATAKQRQDWTVQAAEALAVVHEADVIHCDVTPRNFILNGTLELHIADFAGSSVAGSLPTVTTSPRFQPPGWSWKRKPEVGDDIFALGSVLYFIMHGHEPYPDMSEDEAERRFSEGDFPDVSSLPCGHIIRGCWTGDCKNARHVGSALATLYTVEST
ncbi:hypothetical protein ED733_000730 [Metarhizium rileyi]|uniref:EKC/KEOPS complex subunit BUD32 n=1 Tax=Metarhizium rileyi (strain RCEF 4871) TaxID=1649241 RepID=A0A5C6G3G1_METRR|nr:hypothetical protein ED733_000730 [Metarhizium rileyi]